MAGIYHNATLGVISLSSDGSNWITIADKNLGATTVYNYGDTLSEANAGKYYEIGNNYGFPRTGTVTTSSTEVDASSYSPSTYSSSTFITTGSGSWDSSHNPDLRGGVTGTVEAMRGPCDSDFHIPSKDEWTAVYNAGIALGALTAASYVGASTYLKLPLAGLRRADTAETQAQGTFCFYGTCTVFNDYHVYYLRISSTSSGQQCSVDGNSFVSYGFSIRPFKNEAAVPDYNDTWTKLYGDDLPDRPIPKLKWLVKGSNYYYFKDAPVHASGITLDKDSISLITAGQTEQLTATVTPDDAVNKKVIWSSSDTTVATVSSTGLVTCVTPGNCTITATCADGGASTSCSISKLPSYLCFTANTAGSTVKLTKNNSPTVVTLETSTDGTNWNTYTIGTTITLSNIGDRVYWRNTSETTTTFSTARNHYYKFEMTGSVAGSGDITSLLNKNLTTTLVDNCFYYLFYQCSSLTAAPQLPATTLAEGCYSSMFSNCTGLTSVPELPATNLAKWCYNGMFNACTGLTSIPKLPATALAEGCYQVMFASCSNIRLSTSQTGIYQTAYRIPYVGTGVMATNAFYGMFDATGGAFTGTPTINTTYYTSNEVV